MRLALTLLLTATPAFLTSPLAAQTAADLFEESHCALHWAERYDRVADLNGDGVVDLIGFWHTQPDEGPHYGLDVRGYLGDGNGGFIECWLIQIDAGTHHVSLTNDIETGSFNGDAYTDFVISGGYDTWVYVTSPSNPFEDPSFYAHFPIASDEVLVADFDSNGLDDVVLGWYPINLYLNYGFSQFAHVTHHGMPGAVQYASGELNGDGRDDLVLTGISELHIIPVAGGQFFPSIELEQPFAQNSLQTTVGDVDGDGDLDVVLFDELTEQYKVYRRTGPAEYVAEPVATGGPASDLIDIDGDGDLDGLCCGNGGPPGSYPNDDPSMYRICLNDGTGAFGPSISIDGLGAERLAGVADLDADGDLDLIAGRCVLYNLQSVGYDYCPQTVNSTGAAATLVASGSASIVRNDLVLDAQSLPPGTFGHVFFGPTEGASPLGSGVNCVGGPWFHRMPVQAAGTQGAMHVALDHSVLPTQPGSPGSCPPGDTRYFQLWYRDGGGSHMTNAYAVTFAP